MRCLQPHSNFFIVMVILITLVACAPNSTATSNEGNVPASAGAQTNSQSPVVPVTGGIQHQIVPVDLPRERVNHTGDADSSTTASQDRAPSGDRFTLGQFERPFNANTMDHYFLYLDIQDALIFQDDTWLFVVMTLKGRDDHNALRGKYAAELDLNRDGRGDLLIIVDHPASTDWTTDGVQVWADKDGDVGGNKIIVADGAVSGGNGYETLVFDQGRGDDPDTAWARIAADNPNTIQIAIKQSLLASRAFLVGLWAGNQSLNPALFDLNDHFTHEQAGAALKELENFYPIKGLSELDNTCRIAVGFLPTGTEPGVCPVPGAPKQGCTLDQSYCNQPNVCQYGGTFNPASCSCQCSPG